MARSTPIRCGAKSPATTPTSSCPRPIVRDSATTTRDGVFRQRCREHPGFPPAAIEHLGIIVITPEKWEDNAMIVLGRGCRLLTLYINPAFFRRATATGPSWPRMLKWVRHNAGTLDNTELILGDPLTREPYGYAHFRGTRGNRRACAIRSSSRRPCKVKLDESVGLSAPAAAAADAANAALAARIVYPYHEALPGEFRGGDVFECQLQGYETKVIQFEPPRRPSAGPPVPGTSRRNGRRTGSRTKCSDHPASR